jgi:hypothetical protein
MKPLVSSGLVAASFAAALVIGAVSTAEAGHGGHMGGGHMSNAFKGGSVHVGGNMGRVHSYSGGNIAKFHTNPGGKYVYRGNSGKFHTNKGGKYAWSGKYDHDHDHFNHHHHGRFPWWYGLPLYSYGYGGYGGCGWLYRQAVATGSDYWWNRYYQCTCYY